MMNFLRNLIRRCAIPPLSADDVRQGVAQGVAEAEVEPSWFDVADVVSAFGKTPLVEITQSEYDAFFDNPVWDLVQIATARDMSGRFKTLLSLSATAEQKRDAMVYIRAVEDFRINKARLVRHIVDHLSDEAVKHRRKVDGLVSQLEAIDPALHGGARQ